MSADAAVADDPAQRIGIGTPRVDAPDDLRRLVGALGGLLQLLDLAGLGVR
jgi:hypothetical protein